MVLNYILVGCPWNVPDRHIMFVSGRSSEQSISHYSARPSAPQLESVSDTISNALQYNQTQSTQISTVSSTPSATPLIESLNRMASSVSMSSASASFPSGFFNNCNIQGRVQVFFGLQSRSDGHNWLGFSSILQHISRFPNRIWAFAVMFCSTKGELLD